MSIVSDTLKIKLENFKTRPQDWFGRLPIINSSMNDQSILEWINCAKLTSTFESIKFITEIRLDLCGFLFHSKIRIVHSKIVQKPFLDYSRSLIEKIVVIHIIVLVSENRLSIKIRLHCASASAGASMMTF